MRVRSHRFPREAIGSRIERRVKPFGCPGGKEVGCGYGVWGSMQQVVRFSKAIEIDGFPIPWQTPGYGFRCSVRGRACNTPKLLSIRRRELVHINVYTYAIGKWDGESLRLLLLHFHLVMAFCFDTLYATLYASTLFMRHRTWSRFGPLFSTYLSAHSVHTGCSYFIRKLLSPSHQRRAPSIVSHSFQFYSLIFWWCCFQCFDTNQREWWTYGKRLQFIVMFICLF